MGLAPLPDSFVETRLALHRVAEQVVAPARKPHNEIALTRTPGGFGTPPFEHDGRSLQVRVDGAELVVDEDGAERRAAIESIAEAAELVGADLYPDGLPGDTTALAIDAAAAERLAEFYAFGQRSLEALIATVSPADEASAINLWPEHFDLAIEAGPESLGRRANYGASPGDPLHPQPYVYVGPWQPQTRGGLWNATAFDGAEVDYADLVSADDPEQLLADFFAVRREALAD
ncbi:MAG: hypothetical protein QOI10_2647 [Solirubrobacterales bacterium]|jgi:hypothetical protein|nr:hypothetical protein [Solirubrobacterales bacterium]